MLDGEKLNLSPFASNAANNVPGMNSLAKLHDFYQISFDRISQGSDTWLRTALNVPAMIPATAINYGALLDGTLPYKVQLDSDRK